MENTIIIGAGISNDRSAILDACLSKNYRARITRLESGETLITPIKEGTRGPLYSEPLTTTQHGKLTKTTRNWHVAFDIPVSENLQYVGECLEKEVKSIINYIRLQ